MSELQALHDYLCRLDQKQKELTRLVAESRRVNNPAEARSSEKAVQKSCNVEQRIDDARKRIPEIEEDARAIIRDNRSYVIQERVLQELRYRLSSVCRSAPLTSPPDGLWNKTPSVELASEQSPDDKTTLEVDPILEQSAAKDFRNHIQVPLHYVPWTLLKSDPASWEMLRKHYAVLSGIRGEKYDEERLRFVYDFRPDEMYLGRAAFEGYVVFCFAKSGRAVLECPKVGNAIYAMSIKDWKPLSQESKTTLLLLHRHTFSRIIHTQNWQYELRLWIECGGTPLFEFFKSESVTDL